MAVDWIPRRKHSGQKGDESGFRHVLRFIFQQDVPQLLAWGNISLKCEGKWEVFPGAIRKMSTEHMWRAYRDREIHGTDQDTDIYGRSVFLRIVRMLTRGEQKRRSSVEYLLGRSFKTIWKRFTELSTWK